MMSGHGVNPIFFDKKNEDWTSRTLANPSPFLHPITSHFCLTPSPSPPVQVDVICVSPLKRTCY